MKNFISMNKKRRRVLVVDDELINRELLEAILSQNYDVSCATNGREAIEMLRSSSEPYSLILLDILMPEKSGLQTLSECKADDRLKDIPIIVMTSEKSAEARSIRMGAADFISKPYRMPEVIIARCERVIELSEDRALIRSIETDPVTGFYIKVFFMAYVSRIASNIKRPMDAVAIRLSGTDNSDYALKMTAEYIRDALLHNDGIACRYHDDGDIFYVYCNHVDDYEKALSEMQSKLSNDPGTSAVKLSIGIRSDINAHSSAESCFTDALKNCRS